MSRRFVTAAGLLGCLTIAVGSQVATAGTPVAVLLAQAQPSPQPQNVEANIASLHQRLQIIPAQEPPFNAVANVMRENARAEASAPAQPPANATAVDDLRAFIRYSEVELAGYKRLLPALEGLYATMSPTQKRIADAIFREGPGGR